MTTKSRRTLGLDPGLARLGWAALDLVNNQSVLVAAGCLTTPAKQPTAERLNSLSVALQKILKLYKPDSVAIEQVFFTKNVSTALLTSQVRGMVLTLLAGHKLPIVEFTPTAVKSAVTGDGRADKRQIQQMVKILLRLKNPPRNDDTTDAIAIALCGLNTKQYT